MGRAGSSQRLGPDFRSVAPHDAGHSGCFEPWQAPAAGFAGDVDGAAAEVFAAGVEQWGGACGVPDLDRGVVCADPCIAQGRSYVIGDLGQAGQSARPALVSLWTRVAKEVTGMGGRTSQVPAAPASRLPSRMGGGP